jgi:hypothetical protein
MLKKMDLIMIWTAIACMAFAAHAAMNGTIVGIEANGDWTPGRPIIMDIPAITSIKVLSQYKVMGPCFSPLSADSVAFINTDQNSEIQIVRSDGTSAQPLRTGIRLNLARGGVGEGYAALYWLRLSGGDYFYWVALEAASATNGGVYRCKFGTTTIEKLINGPYFWGGFSLDGLRGASARNPSTYVDKLDLTAKVGSGYWRGCNASISPDGRYILMNLATAKVNGQAYGESECTMVRDWVTGNPVDTLCDIQCANDMQRWSHFDNQVWMFRNFIEEDPSVTKNCATKYPTWASEFGVIYNWTTGERIQLGSYFGFDYFPGKVGAFGPVSVVDPVFSPGSGELPATQAVIHVSTATPGASIRYTTDNSTPSTTNGALLGAQDSFTVTLAFGSTLIVKAIAFKQGLTSSGVVSATFQGHDPAPDVVVTGPAAGRVYGIGDTIHVTWTNKTVWNSSGMQISLSLDNGKNSASLTADTTIGSLSPSWQNFPWKIPATLIVGGSTQSTITQTAIISVTPYGTHGTVIARSGVFSIRQSSGILVMPYFGAINKGRQMNASTLYDIRGRQLKSADISPEKIRRGIYLAAIAGPKDRISTRVLVVR